MNRKWDVTTSQTLTKQIDHHKMAFDTITKEDLHIMHQLLCEKARVKFLMENIISKNASICAVLLNI